MTDNVGLWHLNEASWSGAADEVIDSSGTGNHGQSAGTANTTATAQIGRAGTFDGDSDYVSVGTTDLITQTKGTISFWIKTSTDSAGTVISTGDTDANNYFAIQIGNGATGDCANELISIIRNGANRRICYTTATRTELIDGNWHHIAITGDSMYKVYLDGVRKTLNNNSDGAWFDVTGVDSARIGATYRGGSNYLYFNGEIDELAVWSDELSGKEISAIYNIQKGLLDGHEASGDYTSRIMDAGGMWHGLRLLGYLIVHYTKHFLIMEGQILVIPLEL